MKRKVFFNFCFFAIFGANLLAGPVRSTTGFEHSIYSDRRTTVDWSQVLVVSLPRAYTLIPGINASHTGEYSALGGSLGFAFNLPGQFYGQSAYALRMYLDDSGGTVAISSFLHSISVDITYETATWFLSPSLEVKFSRNYLGALLSPYFRFYPGGWGYFFIKYFGSAAADQSEFIINNSVWTGVDLRVFPKLSVALEGTAGTLNEAGINGVEYTGTAGINVSIGEKAALMYRFHYSFGHSSGAQYKRIKNGFVLDLKF